MRNADPNRNMMAVKLTDPEKTDDIDRVERATSQLVVNRARATGAGRRDVHLKHHGLLQGTFTVDEGIPAAFQHGVFRAGQTYKAWLRFSSSNKFRQSDAEGDGRGIAIKLLEVENAGVRLTPPGVNLGKTQDFLLINGPAFFARNAADMALAAELQQKDQFPSSFFASLGLLKGLAALVQMARTQADSPLELTYFSQTPYKLGAESYGVKYRLRPISITPAVRKSPLADRLPKGRDYLFEALRDRLEEGSKQDAVVFEFAVQVGRADGDFPLDDATVVWNEDSSPFQRIGTLHIPPQTFDSKERMDLAEDISFNPWNGFEPHCPLGSLNAARIYAYKASRDARHRLNGIVETARFDYSVAEWEARSKDPGRTRYTPDPSQNLGGTGKLVSGVAMLFPKLGSWFASFLSSRWGYIVAPLLFAGLLLASYRVPELFEAPLLLAANKLPSERMIPPAELNPRLRNTKFEKEGTERARDPRWVFRYGAIGTEAGGGVPYWIFRALPRMFRDRFGPTGDWSKFGLKDPDDDEYYSSYHELPRGVVLTTPEANLGGTRIGLDFQVVAFNCATCHRGEYLDTQGNPHFVDGMPNTQIDAAGYKRAVIQSFRDERFNTVSVISAINELLALEHAKRHFFPGSQEPTPSELSPVECAAYALIVAQAKKTAFDKPIDWLDLRAENGPGRLDAFGALRYEFLGYSSIEQPPKIATVDLPSVWHQSGENWRSWHHYDGNTQDARARNFGSIIGVGGNPLSINKSNVYTIGNWLDGTLPADSYYPNVPNELSSPSFPTQLGTVDIKMKETGQAIFVSRCASCHGTYDTGKLVKPKGTNGRPSCMDAPAVPPEGFVDQTTEDDPNWRGCGGKVEGGTDSCRARAVDPLFVYKLNAFGASANVWSDTAFRSTGGYLCPPLDGIWARAPYLHNGSVPTLDALLGPLSERPKTFNRGNPAYDVDKGGFSTEAAAGRPIFEFDTSKAGNNNIGHEVIVANVDERQALIAYLLTL